MSRTFKLHRGQDVSNVSGTGIIAEGVLFSDGHVALHWLGRMPTTTTLITLQWVLDIHGHDGKTRLVWDDGAGDDAEFSEKDISYLHEILSQEDMVIWHFGARRLLHKLRVAMGHQTREDNPVKS